MVLLDTCTLLWLVGAAEQLSAEARSAIEQSTGALFVSAITAFEIGVKHRKRALQLPLDPVTWYAEALAFHGLCECPVTGVIAGRSTQLPRLHADPCDRILVATAGEHGWTLLTPDPLIQQYPGITVRW
jgi:PIN domain nuclease of toxin-antitoxin system